MWRSAFARTNQRSRRFIHPNNQSLFIHSRGCSAQAHDESRLQSREQEETKRQMEEDADHEILDIKNTYEKRLRDEKEANMKLKGQ